jgi:hypothetical protein
MATDAELLEAHAALMKLNESEMVQCFLYTLERKYPITRCQLKLSYPKQKVK